MAFDGIVTRAMTRELNEKILYGKIEKVYQPEADELVFHIPVFRRSTMKLPPFTFCFSPCKQHPSCCCP